MRHFNILRQLLAILLVVVLAAPEAAGRSRKGEKLFREGQTLESRKELEKALESYEKAYAEDPNNPEYSMAVKRVRFQAAQARVDAGQKLRSEGRLEEALAEFQRAYAIDPGSTIAEQELRRTYQMIAREKKKAAEPGAPPSTPEERALTPAQLAKKELEERISTYAGAPQLKPVTRQISSLKMNNQPPRVLFETVAKLGGINVVFDPDYLQQAGSRNFSVDLSNSTIEDALDYLAVLTKSFWKPLASNVIFVTQDNIQKRRDYEDQVAKVIYLQNVTTAQELQEISVALRSVVEARRLFTYNSLNAIIIRGTPDQVALVEKLAQDLDKPKSEVVVDVFVMEVNRSRTRDLAAALASGSTVGGLRSPVQFTPRNPVLFGGQTGSSATDTTTGSSSNATNTTSSSLYGSTYGATASTTAQSAISLARLGRISTNDFSVTLPGALFQAVLTDRSTRVLQRPQVRTVEGQKGELKIGDRYPYATGSFQPGIGGVGISPLVSTQFQFADVGVNLTLTPKVHPNDEVSMHVELDISSVRDRVDVGGLSQPVIGQRKMTHDIRVKEGEVTLIGGLIQNQDTKSLSGIPGLASIPGLRSIFGSNSTEKNQSELMIALIPHIVRSPEFTENNLKAIATGTDQQVKISINRMAEKPAPAAEPKPAKPEPAPPAPAVTPPAPAESKPAAPPAAAPPKLTLNVSAPQAALGSPVMVTVEVENAADLFSAPLRLKFDPKVLRLNEVTRGNLFSLDGQNVIFTRNIQNDIGEVAVNLNRMPGSTGVQGNGVLITLAFQAIGPGASKVTVVDAPLKNSRLEPIPVAAPEATILVK